MVPREGEERYAGKDETAEDLQMTGRAPTEVRGKFMGR